MTNGVRPTFKFWEDQHRTLGREGGGYVLVWYRAEGREITVVHVSRCARLILRKRRSILEFVAVATP